MWECVNLTVESSYIILTILSCKLICYKYNFQYYLFSNNELYLEENQYYSPNIGFIKLEQLSKDEVGKWYINLTEMLFSYKVNQ